jgi:hypothetical protein
MMLNVSAHVRGDTLVRRQPDRDVVMMKQRGDPGQHIRIEKQRSGIALRCLAPEWRYVFERGQGDRYAINIPILGTNMRPKGSRGGWSGDT